MAGTTVEQAQGLNNAGVLKFHVGGILIADGDAAIPEMASLINSDGTVNIPDGYVKTGWITSDGIQRTRSMSADDTKGWQSMATIRTDVTDDEISYKVKFQEPFNLATFAFRQGLTLAEAAPLLTSAGFSLARDTSGRQPKRRGLILARDTSYNITFVQAVPNLKLSDTGDESYNRTSETQLDATLKALYDADAGTDVIEAMGGPGFAKIAGTASADTTTP